MADNNCIEFRVLKLRRLQAEWQRFQYGKFSGLKDQMEWSVMEVLLMDEFDFLWVGSSYIDYPSLPRENIENAGKMVAAAKTAKTYLEADFQHHFL